MLLSEENLVDMLSFVCIFSCNYTFASLTDKLEFKDLEKLGI